MGGVESGCGGGEECDRRIREGATHTILVPHQLLTLPHHQFFLPHATKAAVYLYLLSNDFCTRRDANTTCSFARTGVGRRHSKTAPTRLEINSSGSVDACQCWAEHDNGPFATLAVRLQE
jgi:hypothetical protein